MIKVEYPDGYRYGELNQLEVINTFSKGVGRRTRRVCLVKCDICSKDTELHGEGLFETAIYDLKKGVIPCGCSKVPKWTPEQWITRIKRASSRIGIEFVQLAEEWKGQTTKLILYCPKHNHTWDSTSAGPLIEGGGCPLCAWEDRAKGRLVDDQIMIDSFFNTKVFHKDTVFWRIKPNDRLWYYNCPVCSNDEYVQEGVCDGIFKSDRSNLRAGKLTCRCSNGHRWSTAERQFQIQKIINDNQLDIEFVRWLDNKYNGQESRFILKNSNGEEFEKSIANFIDRGCWTLSGRNNDVLRTTYVYILEAKSRVSEFTGFGITTKLYHRFKEHENQLDKHGFYIDSVVTVKTTWDKAFEIEQSILNKFPRNPQDMIGFKKEATFYEEFDAVVNFVEITLQQEGQRVELKDLLE